MSVKVIYFILSIFWINYCGPVDAEGWSGTLDESVDEQNDAEIFRAVVESMRQWELHKKTIHRVKREASRVCYEDVGCFEDTGPFSYLEMLPSPPKDVGTRFFVYGSRKARSVPMEVPADDINEKAHNAIDQELPTKVIVHGFGSGCDHVWVYEMRSALMSVHDCNIVCVDWSPGSVLPNYVRAAANTRLVGRQLAKLIRGLDVPLDKVHLIGFSLGAHVAGFAGAELGNVSRITGLDPAGPLFESQDPRARLDESDANFVDVIHSNGEQLILGGLGSWQPMGDVDFYPNGGRMQTGCSNLFVGAVSDIIWTGTIEGRSLCNHRRAYKLFTDSVSPKCRFPSFPCEKGYDGLLQGDCFPCGYDRPCGDMGYYSDVSNARGQLYLVTREEEPFCAHQYQIKLFNSRSERPARSYGKLQVTLVGAGGFNETFTMTRKDDEELVVGAILHKIVVPHPVVIDLEAIEVKYTAYSGWISSGLASWSIDKVSVLDSFGKSLSICRRGLILESGHQIHLPLYPGECNIPIDTDKPDNSTLNVTETSDLPKNNQELEKTETKNTGIGPFTKDQNFEKTFDHKDSYTIDMVPLDRQRPTKNIGPFTKDQNIRITEETPSKPSEDPKQTIWTFVDINETGNSLENPEPPETGRGFSNPYIPPPTKPLNPPQNPPEFPKIDNLPEIQEPVLQIKKKETGRSMRLPEITEPILRPRMTRQNPKNPDPEGTGLQSKEKINEEDPKGFTVQFLPERLAGLFAQAERYARQTLLPLISQYTPSFISGSRKERLKYFPPLEVIEVPSSESSIASPNDLDIVDDRKNKESAAFNEEGSIDRSSDWVPIAFSSSTERNESSFRASDNSEGKWINREGKVLFQSPSKAAIDSNNEKMMNNSDTKGPGTITNNEDWVPITDKPSANVEVGGLPNKKGNPTLQSTLSTLSTTNTSEVSSERRFIPLVDFENPNDSLVLSSDKRNDEDAVTTTESNERILSHIQKIKSGGGNNGFRNFETRSMAFPYAYERKTDPRTRYIPLVPEEDLGKRGILQEREE